MNTAMAMPGNTASTFLTYLFGSGLEDDRYVVERFRTFARSGPRRPWIGVRGRRRRRAGAGRSA